VRIIFTCPVAKENLSIGQVENAKSGFREEKAMRQIARNIARETMKRAGMKRFNKRRKELGGRSYFSINWRETAQYALTHPDRVFPRV